MNIRTLPQLLIGLVVIITPLRASENFIEGGDPADGQMIFRPSRTVEAKIVNQEVGATVSPRFQLTMKFAPRMSPGKDNGMPNHIGLNRKIFVDPMKTYRLKVLVSRDSAPLKPKFTGYALNVDFKSVVESGEPFEGEDGGPWKYALLENEGEGVPGATVWACTIGPKDSGADYLWPENVIAISFRIYFYGGEKGDQMEILKVSCQEVL